MESLAANRIWTPDLDHKARGLDWLLLDVDGVLTDGRLHLSATGEIFKSFHVRDGLAIQLARAAGLEVGLLTARTSEIVTARARDLGIEEVVQGRQDKAAAFRELVERRATAANRVAYLGDDLQDLPVLGACGLSVAPCDAARQVLERVDFVTGAAGGHGAVRELIERLLEARGAWASTLAAFEPPVDGDAGP